MSTNDFKVLIGGKKSRSKYGNKKTEYNGRWYDSKREAQYAKELDMLSSAQNDTQRVVKWEPQVRYQLTVNDIKIATYVLDFKVEYADGRVEFVDVKGMRTSVYKLKKKLMLACHGITIKEVE